VQPTSFREQARWLAPRLARDRIPSAAAYRQYLEMTRLLAKQLGEAGAPPFDLLDVVDFIRLTTSPTARKAMLARKAEIAVERAAAEAAEAA
jgi:hypothetical protein